MRIGHSIVPAANVAPLLVVITQQTVHEFRGGLQILQLTGLKSGAFGTIPGIVAAQSWRGERLTESPAARITAAMNGLKAICGICREIIR